MNYHASRFILATCLLFLLPALATSDPCGMVTPIYLGPGTPAQPPIVRVGLQQTYVFHRKGVETFVIRPGFRGNVDNFGMLIPFPNPPAIRKVPDNVFDQIANAIDPPEVVIDLRHIKNGLREVLARENLKFAAYNIQPQKNQRDVYDAKINGRPEQKDGYRLSLADVDRILNQDSQSPELLASTSSKSSKSPPLSFPSAWLGILTVALTGYLCIRTGTPA